jgi:hypothetical protein
VSASTPSPSFSAPSAPSTDKHSNSNGVAIGVAVGVGVGALFAITLGICIVFKRRQKRKYQRRSREGDSSIAELQGASRPKDLDTESIRQESKQALVEPLQSPELDASPKALIPNDAQELDHQPRYEMGPSPSKEKDEESAGQPNNREHPGQYFEGDGVYRHEAPA